MAVLIMLERLRRRRAMGHRPVASLFQAPLPQSHRSWSRDIEVGRVRHPAHLLLEGHARRQLKLQLLNRTLNRNLERRGEAAPGCVTKKWRRLRQRSIRLLKAENPPAQPAL